jgi:hypothetical protein
MSTCGSSLRRRAVGRFLNGYVNGGGCHHSLSSGPLAGNPCHCRRYSTGFAAETRCEFTVVLMIGGKMIEAVLTQLQ